MEIIVDLLQSILDLLNDHWVNNSIISQFYSNVFYFLDSSLLSSLIEMIKGQHFVASHSGPIVRAHLNMLEGWACGVGLKEEVLKNLAHLSAAVDLLATEEVELVQVSNLCVCVCLFMCAHMLFLLCKLLLNSISSVFLKSVHLSKRPTVLIF